MLRTNKNLNATSSIEYEAIKRVKRLSLALFFDYLFRSIIISGRNRSKELVYIQYGTGFAFLSTLQRMLDTICLI